MICLHDDYELTAEDLRMIDGRFNVIDQHFVCLECGAIGERTFRIPIEIDWNGNQQKLPLEE
tara:strand:- start:2449 stop:2634 length:186 start_codon:yes stop_codon:yes gene_type:complete